MSDLTHDGEDTEAGARPPSILMGLPDELAEWADQNQALVLRVQRALNDSYTSLTEEQIWDAIASVSSPEWREARQRLRSAENAWNDMQSPDNVSLGSIGFALDSDERDIRRDRYDTSLSDFTIINEGLRQRPDLRNLLSVLLVQKRMVDQSTLQTASVQRATLDLEGIVSLTDEFQSAARRPPFLQRQFAKFARRVFDPQQREPATSVTVPWLPKT